ncbi:MAG: WYL domain-containing protein [Anaeromyxobacter sp.]
MAPTKKPRPEARLLALASFILAQRAPVTRARIYERFPRDYTGSAAAKEKKFTRDKGDLEELGFVLVGEPLEGNEEDQFGYRIDARASTLPAIGLTADEAAVVWAAGTSALRLSDHPLRDALENALRKLAVGTRTLPPRAAAPELDEPEGAPAPDGDRLLQTLVGAWQRRKRVTLEYFRVASNTLSTREVDLYGWAQRRGEYVFVGHCHLRKDLRLFYLSRVHGAKANAKRPGQHDYEIPESFDIGAWARQAIWDYRVHPPVAARVRFTGSLAPIARELVPDATLERQPDGARLASFEVRNVEGLARQALAWGPEAEVLAPEEARAKARELLARLAAGLEGGAA